jgi:MoxR-like ATPase
MTETHSTESKTLAQPTPTPAPLDERGRETLVARAARAYEQVLEEVGRVIVGQREVIEQSVIALFAQGHCVFVGVPGLAKTLLVSTLSQALGLSFSRVQFTPDLMPSDITGTDVLQEDPETRRRAFQFIEGPIFANLLLADELNRTPPKTQAALLQAMQEREVTAAGRTYELPRPFLVFATQNPVEQEGTYELPEAQLDRFMMMVKVGYPSLEEEREVVRRTTQRPPAPPSPCLSTEELIAFQDLARDLPVADAVVDYAVRLTRASRPDDPLAPEQVKRFVRWGAGPRAGQSLIAAAKARALLYGRLHASREDVRHLAPAVLTHRLLTNYEAEAEGVSAEDVVRALVEVIQP